MSDQSIADYRQNVTHAIAFMDEAPGFNLWIDRRAVAACGKMQRVPYPMTRFRYSYDAWRVTCKACAAAGYGLATFASE